MKAAIALRELTKTFTTRDGPVHALDGVTFDVAEGEFVTVVGRSGCGKSTILKIVSGLLPRTSGSVQVNGAEVTAPLRDVGIVFQAPTLLRWRSVMDNVLLPAEFLGMDMAEARRRARELLDLVGLRGFEQRYPRELSGGMQQRVGVARVLANHPDLMLMDEPFASVDAQTRMTLQEELTRIWEARQPTILFVTHDVEEAVFLANRVIVLSARPGRVREVIHVDLPRPRAWSRLVEDDAYKSLVARVLGLVRSQPA